MNCYFTGVRPPDPSGHFCYPAIGPVSPWGSEKIRYPLLDWHPDRDGERFPRREWPPSVQQPEGVFVHLVVDGWTLIAAWDRSADKRGGCTASFAFDAVLDPELALEDARARWPDVLRRIETHIGRPVVVEPWRP